MRHDFDYEAIDADTEVYGVMGDPIEQSLSPVVHNAAFRELGMNKVMVPFTGARRRSCRRFSRSCSWLDIKGCSVTIPHKETIVPFLQQKEGAVERTGSCNTVVFKDDGQRVGYNTDYRAAMDSLEVAMSGHEHDESASPLFDKQVLIIGAGGVARAIAFGLARRGAHVSITNRHDERATQLAEEIGCRSVTWSMRASTVADVIINATPVGMHPNVDDTPLPPAAFSRPEHHRLRHDLPS